MTDDAKSRHELAVEMIRHQQYGVAISCLENNLAADEKDALSLSLMGAALARSGRDLKRAAKLCARAVEMEPRNETHYIYLADIYRRLRSKRKAIEVLRAGMRACPKSQQLPRLLKQFGVRRRPVVSFLRRSHPVNRYLGMLLVGHR